MYIQVADENCLYYHNHRWPSWPYAGELGTEKGHHTHAKAQVGKEKGSHLFLMPSLTSQCWWGNITELQPLTTGSYGRASTETADVRARLVWTVHFIVATITDYYGNKRR